MIVGDPSDGIWRASTTDHAFDFVSSLGPECLRWTDEGLYGCFNQDVDEFFVGVSVDGGEAFAPLLELPCLRGPATCDAGGSTDVCADGWELLSVQLGVSECSDGAGGAGDGGSAGTGGDAAPNRDAAEGPESNILTDEGCDCCFPGGPVGGSAAHVGLLGTLTLLAAHRLRRRWAATATGRSPVLMTTLIW